MKKLLGMICLYWIWGSTYLAISFGIASVPPFIFGGIRFLLAGALLYGGLRLWGTPAPERKHWKGAAAVGILMVVGGNGLVTWAELTVPTGLAGVIIASVPLWMAVIDPLFLGGKIPTKATCVGLATGFIGVALLVGATIGDLTNSGFGLLALVAASAFWAMGSLLSRKIELPPFTPLAVAMEFLIGGAILIFISGIAGEWTTLLTFGINIDSKAIIALFYLVFIGSMLAFSVYMWLLKNSNPLLVGTYAFVCPVVAVILGWLVKGEAMSNTTIIATILVVLSVAFVLVETQKQRMKAKCLA